MPYVNAVHVLPPELVAAIQKYVEGQLIYVPRRSIRLGWGTCSGSRKYLCRRNSQIRAAYRGGCGIENLAERFHLSRDSIRKIIAGGPEPADDTSGDGSIR